MTADAADAFPREVVIGKNSTVWQALQCEGALSARFNVAMSHRDVANFEFRAGDRVWIYAYSRRPAENHALLMRLATVAGLDVVYVSSASTIVGPRVQCFEYPRVKAQAEQQARELLGARVLTLGLVYSALDELPRGENMATRVADLAAFMSAPSWPLDGGRRMNLFTKTRRPFSSALEAALHRAYGALQRATGPWPCLLRPIDLLLRTAGMRWYGYVYLSNHLWTTTTS